MKNYALLPVLAAAAMTALATWGVGLAGEAALSPLPQEQVEEAYPRVPTVFLEPHPGPAGPSLQRSTTAGWVNILINKDATQQVQNEQQVAVNPLDPDNLVAVWRDFRFGYRRVGYGYSFDGGLTWGEGLFEEPTWPWHSDPGVTVDADGNFHAVILSYNQSANTNGLFIFTSTDGGVTWGDPVTVVNGVPNVFEDKELMACDRTDGPHSGNLYVAWTRFYTTRILMARSIDGGQSFLDPIQVSDGTGVQWPVPLVGTDGEVYVAWVDYSPDRIALDVSYDGGATFGTDKVVTDVELGDGYINGDIWIFSYPAMDADITGGQYDGRLYVAYADYGPSWDVDIFFRYSTDGGTNWSAAHRLNDDPVANGCDQFHPWLTVDETGTVSVVWLDRRNDPYNLWMDCYVTQSTNGGLDWCPNVRVSTVSSDPTAGQLDAGLLGEYIGLAAVEGRMNPVWTDTRRGHQDVFTSRLFLNADVTVELTPDTTTVPQGEVLGYDVTIENQTAEPKTVWGRAIVLMPDGSPYQGNPVVEPKAIPLGPHQVRQTHIEHVVPNLAPTGWYIYIVQAGTPPDDIIYESSFEVEIVSADGR
ncbi:hypothetical protein AMJ39_05625 [candidate division TA06 bacterium DG_24]|nr:MAG: hypothetical protein AMJ39_05625 [candidate division TA06 bacterium DG_24]